MVHAITEYCTLCCTRTARLCYDIIFSFSLITVWQARSNTARRNFQGFGRSPELSGASEASTPASYREGFGRAQRAPSYRVWESATSRAPRGARNFCDRPLGDSPLCSPVLLGPLSRKQNIAETTPYCF
jgi:hypothetical protein